MLLAAARAGVGWAALAAEDTRLHAMGMQPDCLALVEADTVRPVAASSGPAPLIAAAHFGTVRLFDNVAVPP